MRFTKNTSSIMTYVVAWKSSRSVFIVADSVVSEDKYGGDDEFKTIPSVFSEAPIVEEKKSVYEGAMKILKMPDHQCVIAFAGYFDVAREFAHIFNLEIRRVPGEAFQNAFERALVLTLTDDNRDEIQIVLGAFQDGSPLLVTYNSQHDRQLRIDESFVQCGTFLQMPHLSDGVADFIINVMLNQSEAFTEDYSLAAVLARVQILGLQHLLMNVGVGGLFCGVRVDNAGVHWPEDTMYVVYGAREGNYVLVLYRLNCVIALQMTPPHKNMVLSSFRLTDEVMIQLDKETDGELTKQIKACSYITFLSAVSSHIFIVTKKAMENENLLWIRSNPDSKTWRMDIGGRLKHDMDNSRETSLFKFYS